MNDGKKENHVIGGYLKGFARKSKKIPDGRT